MIEIIVPQKEIYDEVANEFILIKETKLQLEHSLISIRKWEAKWHKPFLESDDKTLKEIIDYTKCMTMNKGVDPLVYDFMPAEAISKIVDYIKDPMTATWFSDNSTMGAAKTRNEVVTAEIIYWWMIALNIPSEYEKWHLNQLLTLIKVVSLKNQGPKKVDKHAEAARRRRINQERRARFNSKG